MIQHLSITEVHEKISAAIFYNKGYLIKLEMENNGVMACVEFEGENGCYIVTRGNGTDCFCKSFSALNKLLASLHPAGTDLSTIPLELKVS